MPIATLARHTHTCSNITLKHSHSHASKAISKLNFIRVAIQIYCGTFSTNTSAVSWMANWTELFLLCRRKNPKLQNAHTDTQIQMCVRYK